MNSIKLCAVLSIPRLGFNDFWGAVIDILGPRGIPLFRYGGAYWEQGITRVLENAIGTGAEYILTLDFDSVFSGQDIDTLATLAVEHPEADAIIPIQVARSKSIPLFSMRSDTGAMVAEVDKATFDADLVPVDTGHFGCTLLKASAFPALARPWFHSQPDAEGRWGDGRIDADIFFWKRWRQAGKSIYLAPRVAIGHLEQVIAWPDQHMATLWQYPSELKSSGPPAGRWE